MGMNSFINKLVTHQIYRKFDRIEPVLFVIVAILSVIPVFLVTCFPTLDGPSHLYNSNLIIELIKGNRHIAQVFSLNSFAVPNWSGHAILAFFNFFLPAIMAEKILIGFYAIGLPLVFRMFIRQLKGDIAIAWLIFPFTFSFMFYLGFYNFCLGTLFFFWGLYVWLKNQEKPLKRNLLAFLFSVLIFYSHIVVFAIFVFTLFCILINDLYRETRIQKKPLLKIFFIKAVWLVIAFLPAGIMGLIYIISNFTPNNGSRIEPGELLTWLYNIRSIVAFNFGREGTFTITCFGLIMFLILMSVFISVYKKLGKKEHLSSKSDISVVWLFLAGTMLGLYFILPDEIGSGGYISVRLNWFFFIYIIVWLSKERFYPWIRVSIVCIVLFIHIGLMFHHNKYVYGFNVYSGKVIEASKYIEPNSVVLPYNFSNQWLLKHFSNYLGIDKPLIILENYEASTGYFPVKWNDITLPQYCLHGNDSLKYCSFIRHSQNSVKRNIDYLFFIGNHPDTSDKCIYNILKYSYSHCKEVYRSSTVVLFKCKAY